MEAAPSRNATEKQRRGRWWWLAAGALLAIAAGFYFLEEAKNSLPAPLVEKAVDTPAVDAAKPAPLPFKLPDKKTIAGREVRTGAIEIRNLQEAMAILGAAEKRAPRKKPTAKDLGLNQEEFDEIQKGVTRLQRFGEEREAKRTLMLRKFENEKGKSYLIDIEVPNVQEIGQIAAESAKELDALTGTETQKKIVREQFQKVYDEMVKFRKDHRILRLLLPHQDSASVLFTDVHSAAQLKIGEDGSVQFPPASMTTSYSLDKDSAPDSLMMSRYGYILVNLP